MHEKALKEGTNSPSGDLVGEGINKNSSNGCEQQQCLIRAPEEGPQKLPEEYLVDGSHANRRQENSTQGCCHCKYSNALKTLIPCRPSSKDRKELPSNSAGLINFFTLSWLTKVMWKAWKKGLKTSDLWKLHQDDTAEKNSMRLERLWEQEKQEAKKKKRDCNFISPAWKFARTRIVVCIILSFFLNCINFLGPSVFVKITLDYVNDPVVDHLRGTYIVLAVIGLNLIRGALFNCLMILGIHTAIRLTGGLQGMIYKKMIRLKTGGEKIAAQITNICSNDMERLVEACISSVFLTVTPVLFIANLIYGYWLIGPWSLLGFLIYLLFFPIMGLIGKGQSVLRVYTVRKTDQRVSLMSEILNSLKLIKMYAWEDSFAKKIAGIRKEEMKKHRVTSLLQAVSSTAIPSVGILATIATLLGYTLAGLDLTSAAAFTIFSVFNSMQYVVGVLPFTIRACAEARISLQRVQKLLDFPENDTQGCRLFNNSLAIEIKNANFSWDVYSIDLKQSPVKRNKKKKKKEAKDKIKAEEKEKLDCNGHLSKNLDKEENESQPPPPEGGPFLEESVQTLFGINLSVGKEKLVGISGSIGAGKSSLLSSISGDMDLKSGELKVDGRLALVTQQAWIYNATLRENILMGEPFREEWYEQVVECCALRSDFALLPQGDKTEIGERGINLSGGQKQRVSLARAVYTSRDIFLLDDPLSAVDSKVANHIFSKCIKGILKDRTVLLVSHSIHFLEKCDEVVYLKNGRICERGTHDSLMERKGEYFKLMGHDSTYGQNASSEERPSEDQEKKITKDILNEGKLTQEEGKVVGTISLKIYLKLVQVCGGWCKCLVVFFAIFIFSAIRMFNFVWLQWWLDAGDGYENLRIENQTVFNISYTDKELKGNVTDNPQLWMYQLVYGLSFIFLVIVGIVKGVGVTFRVLSGSSKLHKDMFDSIVHAPMSFLDTTPTGRILTRFSRDIDEVDVRIPFFMEFVLQGLFGILLQIIIVAYLFPIFLGPLILVAVVFIFIDLFMNGGMRELKRLDNNLKSPVVQHITSSMTGLSLIRAFNREEEFTKKFYSYLDTHAAALMVFRLSNRWYTYRMDVLATLVIFSITAICIFTKGQFSTAVAGLALSTINGVCGFLPFFMRMKAEFVSRLTCFERLMEYAYNIESEAPQEIAATKPPPSWPSEGAIELKEVKVKYRAELPLVLRGISASIKPSEKIGIVGRPGAGKSSLVSTLLRLIELDSGSMIIDGIDIGKIGLRSLRTSISVIPQDPVLFQGTIRYNLDPFDEHSDDAIWNALDLSHLKTTVMKLNFGLNAEVEASGENFSVGERQLICLTRALLRKSKILLLDEATASVDVETDHLIQETIQEAFKNCTVLTIAHRLNTIASYDRIMVMDEGMVREFDSPENLMNRNDSLFAEMMRAMGVRTVEEMKTLS